MNEHDIQTQIIIELCKLGCIVHRTNSGVYYTKDGRPVRIGIPGMSDLQGHTPSGKCFYIEVKKPGEKPRENQLNFLNAMEKSGAIAFWCCSAQEAVEKISKI